MVTHSNDVVTMYTKLFQSILTSTIWGEDDQTRIVFITLLAMADKNGEIICTIPGLARIASVTIDQAEKAIKKLESPDKYSRTAENEGRRIEQIDGGWRLLNHEKYRIMGSKADSQAKNAERQKRHRERKKAVTDRNGSVTHDRDIADTDADTDTDTDTEENGSTAAVPRQGAIFAEAPSLAESVRFGEMVQPIPIPPAAVEAWHAKNELNQWDVLRSGRKWSDCLRAWWKAIPPKDQHKWAQSPDKGSGNTNTPEEPRKRKLNAVQRNLVEMGIPPHEWKSKYGVDPVY
jgi:hypothetical protein